MTFAAALQALTDPSRPEPLDYAKRTFASHRATMFKEDGVYRHIRVAEPGTRMYGFEVVTYPYYLVVTGDIGTFVFSRVEDMLTLLPAKRVHQLRLLARKAPSTHISHRVRRRRIARRSHREWPCTGRVSRLGRRCHRGPHRRHSRRFVVVGRR